MTFSIINKLQLEGAQRIDAEYYNADSQIKNNFILGNDIIDFVQYGTSDDLNEEKIGYPVLRLNEFDSFFFKIPEKFCDTLGKNLFLNLRINKGDILICRTNGNPKFVGKSAIAIKDENFAFASYLFRIKPKQEIINSATLVSFLNSRYGRNEIEKNTLISNQTNFSPASFKNIKIPNFSETLQKELEKIINFAYDLTNQSSVFYSQAENLLLEELDLKNFEEKNKLFSIVNFSEVEKVKRMDAEYFQPKYEKLIETINKHNGCKLNDLATVKKGIEIGAEAYKEEGKTFIRVSSISKDGIVDRDQKFLSNELFDKLKKDFQPTIGEVLMTKDASPGVTCVLNEGCEGIVSGGVVRLKIKKEIDCEPEFLVLCVNSLIGQLQIEREVGGSIILHWKTDQIKNFHVPLLSKEIQQQISDLVKKSHEARKKSKQLLEEAKRKVEEMIEKGNG